MDIETGGGGSVGGNVQSKDFTGRDATDHRSYVDINLSNRNQQSSTLEDRVMDLERLIYGEPKWNEPGMIKRQQHNIGISQINMALNAVMLVLLIVYMLWS